MPPRWKDLAKRRQIRHFGEGETLTVKRLTSGQLRSGLTVKTTAALGATTVVLEGARLSGLAPAGVVVSIDGTDYTTTADAYASATGDEITLTLSSGLVAEAAASTAATIAANVSTTYDAAPHGLDDDVLLGGPQAVKRKMAVYVPGTAVIREGDRVSDAAGEVYSVVGSQRRGRKFILMLGGAA